LRYGRGCRYLAVPNAETIATLDEAEHGGGKRYRGSSQEVIKAMLDDGSVHIHHDGHCDDRRCSTTAPATVIEGVVSAGGRLAEIDSSRTRDNATLIGKPIADARRAASVSRYVGSAGAAGRLF
jgi:hypothetical protein